MLITVFESMSYSMLYNNYTKINCVLSSSIDQAQSALISALNDLLMFLINLRDDHETQLFLSYFFE